MKSDTLLIFSLFIHLILTSRDFTEWMKSVHPPDDKYGSGLKYLVHNINHKITQEDADNYAI